LVRGIRQRIYLDSELKFSIEGRGKFGARTHEMKLVREYFESGAGQGWKDLRLWNREMILEIADWTVRVYNGGRG
jgi:hypothetical protein